MPSFFASALIADGVMSGVPTMYSLERLLLTVLRPLMPIAMATTPNTTRTAAATSPPISKNLRMSRLLSNRVLSASVGRSTSDAIRGDAQSDRGKAAVSGRGAGCDRPRDVERRDDADGARGAGLGDGEVCDPVLRHHAAGLADRAVGCDRDERRDRGRSGGQRIEV